MKTNQRAMLWAALLLFVCSLSTFAQEAKKQLFVVHEDVVKPSMVTKYEKISKNLVTQLKEHGVSEISEMCAATNDFHYYYITPVDNMAALDEKPWKSVQEKMGKEAFEKMWEGYGECYDKHSTYMLSLSPEDSYDPQNSDIMDPEALYRRWQFFYIDPAKAEASNKVVKKWKALSESKNIANGYRVYRGGMGTEQPLILVIEWAKDAAALAAQNAEDAKLYGEEGQELWGKTLSITRKYEVKEGTMRPDLSYVPGQVLADQE